MWRSEDGDVVLEGACASLFAQALWRLAEDILAASECVETGISVFDRLSTGQQAAVLDIIGPAALCKDRPCAPLYAATEAGFVGVFMCVAIDIESIISDGLDDAGLRGLVLRAAKERNICHELTVDNPTIDMWHSLVREIAESYLWDSDYAMIDTLEDLPSDVSARARDKMTIDDKYFSWIPEDYTQERIESSMQKLIDLCRSVPDA